MIRQQIYVFNKHYGGLSHLSKIRNSDFIIFILFNYIYIIFTFYANIQRSCSYKAVHVLTAVKVDPTKKLNNHKIFK